MTPESGTAIEARGTPWAAAYAISWLEKCMGPAMMKITANNRRPRTATGPAIEEELEAVTGCAMLAILGSPLIRDIEYEKSCAAIFTIRRPKPPMGALMFGKRVGYNK